MKYLILLFILSGCLEYPRTEFKCEGGVLYIRDNGAWIQAKLYEDNKCLPMEKPNEKPKSN